MRLSVALAFALLFVSSLAVPFPPFKFRPDLGRGHVLFERGFTTPLNTKADYLKPSYHITAPSGWVNDPNGMFEHNGMYHVFYQHNPAAPVWAAPYWGHVVSSDLVHWKMLPHAIIPDTFYDIDGVFSGSATVLNDGTPVMMYTGVSRFGELGYYYQVQAFATPANVSDPELKRWLKARHNPSLPDVPPGGNYSQWRDPTTAWKEGDTYYMAVGAQQDCVGGAALYSSADFGAWQYNGILFSQSHLAGDSRCEAEVQKGQCSQFGEGGCAMWECPDFFEVQGGVHVFKYSDQVLSREPFGLDWYVLGTRSLDYGSNSTKFSALLDGKEYLPRLWDHGPIYASKAFRLADGRVLWVGWIYETSKGCTQMCSTGSEFIDAQGWQGAQTLLREVIFSADTQELILRPVAEMELLRNRELFQGQMEFGLSFQQGRTFVGRSSLEHPQNQHQQLELLLTFNVTRSNNSQSHNARAVAYSGSLFTLGLVLRTGPNSRTVIALDGSVEDVQGKTVVTSAELSVDTTRTGGATQARRDGGMIALPPGGLAAQDLELRVFVDHSIVEAYGLGGRSRVTSRIYPLHDSDTTWEVDVFGNAGTPDAQIHVDASAWSLESCWVDSVEPKKERR